jgi:hypothetical protein
MILIMHSATLLYHLPFLVRCEPRGPQQNGWCFGCNLLKYIPMKKASFKLLYAILLPRLDVKFLPGGGGKCGHHSTYIISSKIRLSIALRYFAGGSVYDIMLVHGVSLVSIYVSMWGVVDAINSTPELDFHFPNHEQQQEIATGFCRQSGARSNNVVGVIDGLVVCTLMPCLSECLFMNCGQANFQCHQKDEYGLNLQAICNHNLKFTWIEMK